MYLSRRFFWVGCAALAIVVVIGLYQIEKRVHVHSTVVGPHNLPF
jgi:hypothetical protein